MKTYLQLLYDRIQASGKPETNIVYSSVDLDSEFKTNIAFEIYTETNLYQLADSHSPLCMRVIPRNPPLKIRKSGNGYYLLTNQDGTSYTYVVFRNLNAALDYAETHHRIVEEYTPCQDQ